MLESVWKTPKSVLQNLFFLAVFIYLVLPVLIVVPLSFGSSRYLQFPPRGWSLEWYRHYFGSSAWMSGTRNSFIIAAAVAPFATILGTLAALGLVKARFRGRATILAVLISPMIVPVIIYAIAAYGVYARLGLIGSFLGIIMAHTALAVPLVVITVSASLQRFDFTLERAAQSLGATDLQVIARVILPNIWPAVLAAALFAFITSFDELLVVLFVGGPILTIPRKIWEDLVVLIEPTQAAASTVLIVVSTLTFVTVALMSRRRG